jgi:hypothetical protein
MPTSGRALIIEYVRTVSQPVALFKSISGILGRLGELVRRWTRRDADWLEMAFNSVCQTQAVRRLRQIQQPRPLSGTRNGSIQITVTYCCDPVIMSIGGFD